MLKKIGLALAAIILVLIVVIATRPSSFHVERSVMAQASADDVFRLVNDFQKWAAWSPWDKLDPNMKRTFGGSNAGVGAHYSWTGNDKVGEGRMSIEESTPPSLVKIKLEFLKPFAATNIATFTMKPAGTRVMITWSMEGNNDFMGKAFSLFMDMDKMVGGDFERGLASLKDLAEKDAAGRAEDQRRAAEIAAFALAHAPPASRPPGVVPAMAPPLPPGALGLPPGAIPAMPPPLPPGAPRPPLGAIPAMPPGAMPAMAPPPPAPPPHP